MSTSTHVPLRNSQLGQKAYAGMYCPDEVWGENLFIWSKDHPIARPELCPCNMPRKSLIHFAQLNEKPLWQFKTWVSEISQVQNANCNLACSIANKFKMLTAIQHVQLQINGFKENLQVDVFKMCNVSMQWYKLFSLVSTAHKFCCLNN